MGECRRVRIEIAGLGVLIEVRSVESTLTSPKFAKKQPSMRQE